MTVHYEVKCDYPGCHDGIDGGYVGAPIDIALERAEKEYGWLIEAGDDHHLCELHRGSGA